MAPTNNENVSSIMGPEKDPKMDPTLTPEMLVFDFI
jgi:hypothetical protein